MKIERVDHMTIIIKDLERTLWFYGSLLGLEQLPSIDLGDHILRYFAIPGGQRLELNEYQYPTRDSQGLPTDKGTIRHLAFQVDNVKETEAFLTKEGFPFHYPVAHSEALRCSSGLVHDPNGVELEFLEYDT